MIAISATPINAPKPIRTFFNIFFLLEGDEAFFLVGGAAMNATVQYCFQSFIDLLIINHPLHPNNLESFVVKVEFDIHFLEYRIKGLIVF